MNFDPQTVIAWVVVAGAVTFLVVRALRRKNGEDCGGCGPDKFKAKLRR